jgi:hypothetical protein
LPEQILAIDEDRWCAESEPWVVRWKCAQIDIHESGLAPNDGKSSLEAGTHRR